MKHLDDTATSPASTQDPETTRSGPGTRHPHRPVIPHTIRIFAAPIILAWVVLTVIVNVAVPRLEVVSEEHSAPMTPLDAPSMKAMMLLGHNFREFDSNSTVMIVLEGQQPRATTRTTTTTT
ncbi:Siderophore exporter MmpL5 [Mycobacterium pseudokansasii]|nr:Siderophore exporter MmpL5 [Mycobacterium pseudokansasii]VAZ99682.1 Siderophore exporter MmpL5 [Mycobacterium pseudokansasii]